MVIEADNSLNSLRNRRSKTAQAGLRPAYVFPSAISKGGGLSRMSPPPHATPQFLKHVSKLVWEVRPTDEVLLV